MLRSMRTTPRYAHNDHMMTTFPSMDSHGRIIDAPWIHHGLIMDSSSTHNGLTIDSSSTHHRRIMDAGDGPDRSPRERDQHPDAQLTSALTGFAGTLLTARYHRSRAIPDGTRYPMARAMATPYPHALLRGHCWSQRRRSRNNLTEADASTIAHAVASTSMSEVMSGAVYDEERRELREVLDA